MKLQPGEALRVVLAHAPDDAVSVGRLATERGRAFFAYDPSFIASGARFHPTWGAPDPAVIAAHNPRAFHGLHGVFGDSLPDAWGAEIMRRRLARHDLSYESLSAVDRLALVGNTGVGALTYRPDFAEHENGEIDLDALAEGARALDGTPTDIVEELARLGGSSGGARPKVFVARNAAGTIVPGTGAIPDGFDAYIVKFPSANDVRDIGPLEAAYADMARAAGIDVAATMLVPAARGGGYFATRRFDRADGNRRIHMLSIAAIIEVDWSQPSIDYVQLIALVHGITRNYEDAERVFRRMVFNVFAANADDHTKQHSLVQSRSGAWSLAPAYDLTLSTGPNGEHYLAINGKGKNITLDDVYAVARDASIKRARARSIIDEVRTAISGFPAIAQSYGVTHATLAEFKRRTAALG